MDFTKYPILENKIDELKENLSNCLSCVKQRIKDSFIESMPDQYGDINWEESDNNIVSNIIRVFKRVKENRVISFLNDVYSYNDGYSLFKEISLEIQKYLTISEIAVSSIKEEIRENVSIDPVQIFDLRNYPPFEIEKLSKYILKAHESEPSLKEFSVQLNIEGK